CDWYVEFSKPIVQGEDAAARAETQQTTAWVLAQIAHLLHPIAPFITEELWGHIAGDTAGMLITAPWPALPPELDDPAAAAEMDWLVAAITAVRAIRTEVNVPAAARLPLYVKDANPAASERLARHAEHVLRLARVTQIMPADAVPAGGVAIVVDGATLILQVGEVIDLAKEKARLAKEIGRLDGDLKKFAAKLANPDFLAKAKVEIIDEQRE